jgi:hypothetical protein
MTILITAAHAVFRQQQGGQSKYTDLRCATTLKIDSCTGSYTPLRSFAVRVAAAHTRDADIAFLIRVDGEQFPRAIPICPREELPWVLNPNCSTHVIIFHCPLSFYEDYGDDMTCETTNTLKVAKATGHNIKVMDCNLGPGSSGGVALLETTGQLVGVYTAGNKRFIHVENVTLQAGAGPADDTSDLTSGVLSLHGSARPSYGQYGFCQVPCMLDIIRRSTEQAGGEILGMPEFLDLLGRLPM